MKKLKIYITCALKHAPEEFKQMIKSFKEVLAKEIDCEILEFIQDAQASPYDIYHNDIKRCVADCQFIIADFTLPSTGQGYELGTQIEALGKSVIGIAKKGTIISSLILGIPNMRVDYYENVEEMVSLVKKRIQDLKLQKQGKLIVLDGTDGSGKATQTKVLVERFQQEGKRVETFDFPHYQNHFGGLIGECLAGKHGNFVEMSPHVASVLFAADRFESSQKIKQWLSEGAIVILDRYVSANQIHQGGKISNEESRKKFLYWLDYMEHEIFNIPRPDMIIYLDVPVEVSQRLSKEKAASSKKIYTEGADQHEDNLQHLKDAKESGLKMIAAQNSWHRIECYQNEQMLPIEVIHESIWKIATEIIM